MLPNHSTEPSGQSSGASKLPPFRGFNEFHDQGNKFRYVYDIDGMKRPSPCIETPNQSKILSTPGQNVLQSLGRSPWDQAIFPESSSLAVGFFSKIAKLIAIPHSNMQSL